MSSGLSDTDAVVIDHDDVSNYNPDHVLPEPPEVIKNLRAWLKPTAYDLESGEYRKHLASHAPGTGDWVTSTAMYQEWLQSQDRGLLWIKGIPGSGKSVLASKIIRELSRNHPGTPVLFFFFRQIVAANHEPVALLRDWLDQILSYSPPLQQQIKEYVETNRELSSMSTDDLWRDLRMAISGLHGNVFCVADALDEMDGGNWKFVEALFELGNWKPHKVKVILTSRPMGNMDALIRTFNHSKIRLDEEMVDKDISTFVRRALETPTISNDDKYVIQQAIPGQANGIFLYAKLAMDAFLDPGADARAVLKSLPDDMWAMYTELLQEHRRRSEVPDNIQLLILQWVTHSTRPLRLLEMAEMISVTHTDIVSHDLSGVKNLIRAACGPLLEIMPDETVCVVHHTFTEYLTGVNRSPGDGYPILFSEETHAKLGLACLKYLQAGSLDDIHESKAPPRMNLYDHEIGGTKLSLKHPFLKYAASNWHIHLARSSPEGHDQVQVNQALDEFVGHPHYLDAWLGIHWFGAYLNDRRGVTPLHVAARYGLAGWAKHLLLTGSSVDPIDSYGKTPLFWASTSGKAEAVQVLIEAGANPDRAETDHGRKPLHEAASKNHPEVIKLLLGAGVDPLTPKTMEYGGVRECGNTRSTYACHNGHLEAVDAFLPFLKDSETIHRALAWASKAGRSEVVSRILEEPGVDIDRKVRRGTPLFRACQSGNAATIILLLRKGADPTILCEPDEEFRVGDDPLDIMEIEEEYLYRCYAEEGDPKPTRQPRGFTALHLVCNDERQKYSAGGLKDDPAVVDEILDLFIKNGEDIHQRKGCTLLHLTCNNPVWTRLLLERGIDPNIANGYGSTPLHETCSLDAMIQLVEHGKADINKLDEKMSPPLFHFLSLTDHALVPKFLEYRPDCGIQDISGNGPLHIALQTQECKPEIIDALILAGADPNLKNNANLTPFDVIDLRSPASAEMMDILIRSGADINTKDKNGKTPLFRTIQLPPNSSGEPHREIKALIDRGARVDTRDSRGRTLLHEAIRSHPGCPDPSGRHKTDSRLDFLIDLGLDLQAVDVNGDNLLHELSWHSSNPDCTYPYILHVWTRLLDLGVNPDKPNHRGRVPLHNLCCKRRSGRDLSVAEDAVDLLISATKNIDATDEEGITPLHLAAVTSEHNTKKLLDAGANPRISSWHGMTPLHLAVRSRQSNIVGLLLDSLHRTDTGQSEVITLVSWRMDDHIHPISGVDAEARDAKRPLHYACESGRPEVVAMLLKAGATVKVPGLRAACAHFEIEQDYWTRSFERDPGNGDAVGLRPQDVRRSGSVSSDGFRNTARLEEIIEMLLDHGANLSDPGDWFYHDGYRESRSTSRLPLMDYTLKCFTEVQKRRGLEPPGKYGPPSKGKVTFDEHLISYRHEAIVKALQNFDGLKKGEANQELFRSRLSRRDFDVVEQLFHVGVDFLADADKNGKTNFGILVQGGFTKLVDRIGQLELKRQHEKGTWHAIGDKNRPGFGQKTAWSPENLNLNHQPFIFQAVSQELPVFDVLRLLVEKFGADINEMVFRRVSRDGKTVVQPIDSALHQLAKGYWWWHIAQALPYLISRQANLNLKNDKGQTPLHLALESGEKRGFGMYRRDAARLLILSGADVNAMDTSGKTCLAYAGSDAEMVRLLIEHGATVKADALFTAINMQQVDVLETLLNAGVDPNMRFDKASTKPYQADDMDDFLHRWDREDIPDYEWYPLHHAATKLYATYDKDKLVPKDTWPTILKIIDALLAHGANPLAKFIRCTGEDCYHQQLRGRLYGKHIERMIKSIPWVPASDESQDEKPEPEPDTSFSWEGHEECILLHQLLVDGHIVRPLLLSGNIDPNCKDNKGYTLLLAACASTFGPDMPLDLFSQATESPDEQTEISTFRHLINVGADPEARDVEGRNAMHHMLRFREEDIRSKPRILKSLSYMAEFHRSLINQQDKNGKTPLHLAVDRAVYEKKTTYADLLLEAGADPLLSDNEGNTVLHILSRMLWLSTFRPLFDELIKLGCDINARNEKGETPLFGYFNGLRRKHDKEFYSRGTDLSTIDDAGALAALEAAGADFTVRRNDGQGLLHVAAEGHHVRFKTLLDRGLDALAEDNNRRTALDVAAACENVGVLNLFKHGAEEDTECVGKGYWVNVEDIFGVEGDWDDAGLQRIASTFPSEAD
ncbi:hypothetical protein CkaCkLH20_05112 [Colletotrichum karsti]|uniref:NACHT domain-containing protein n=1 Tax=Colletotrichum karsti TaxID=1095194 RepID=A0A9P6LMD5_9PEZI|nr:uncharacterized protein CkaCkLH20_05112 [Colletotrichum karsti]KAF9877412.1 hypothetical protein CkaCkLH20_05112 [Colletotrichum karsti]